MSELKFSTTGASISASVLPTLTSTLTIGGSTQTTAKLTLTGQEYFQAANTSTDGMSLCMGVNRSNNRQLWLMDSARATVSASNYVLRLNVGSISATVDALATDGSTVLPLTVGNAGGVYMPNKVSFGSSTTATGNYDFCNSGGAVLLLRDHVGSAGTLRMVTTGSAAYIQSGTSTATGSAAPLYFTDMSAQNVWMTLTSAGNLGINTTNPGAKFHSVGLTTGTAWTSNTTISADDAAIVDRPVSTTASITGRSPIAIAFRGHGATSAGADYQWRFVAEATDNLAKIVVTPLSYLECGSGSAGAHARMDFFVQSSGHSGLKSRMTVRGDGRIGIGTLTPGVGVDIVNNVAEANIRMSYSANTGSAFIQSGNHANAGINWHYGTDGGNQLHFYNGNYGAGTLRMRITNVGNVTASGSFTGGGADYAEYFESANGEPLAVGQTVVAINGRVRHANVGDDPALIIGVVRPKKNAKTVLIVGNEAPLEWVDKYIANELGEYEMESHMEWYWKEKKNAEDTEFVHKLTRGESERPPEGPLITWDGSKLIEEPKLNPAYDPTATYVPRSERPEWNLVGLLGQIPVLKGEVVNPNWVLLHEKNTVNVYLVK